MEEKLVIITIENFARAQVLKAQLESEGIECFLSNLNLIQASVSEGVKVMVKENDAKKAIKVLLSVKGQYDRTGKKKTKKTKHIRRIMVPVDFSDNALKTAEFALEVAEMYGASIRLLHVYYSPAIDMISIPDVNVSQFNLDIVLNEIQTRAQKDMKVFIDKLSNYVAKRALVNVPISYRIMEGITSDTIINAAESYHPGLIIMGMHGQTVKSGSIIGSEVWKIIQKAKIPVLTIPENSHFDYTKKTFNIMYTTDLDEVEYQTIRKLIVLLSPFKNLKVHCVHASEKTINSYQKIKMEEMKDYLSSVVSHPLKFSFLENKEYIDAFDSYIKSNNIDLICMTTRKRNIIERFFNPSLAKKMLYHTNTPLMIFHI